MTHPSQASLVFQSVSPDGVGRFRLSGVVDFQTVLALFEAGEKQFAGYGQVEIDGSAITRANSAALSLCLQWAEGMRARGGRMVLRLVPESLVRLARVSQVSALLGLDEAGG